MGWFNNLFEKKLTKENLEKERVARINSLVKNIKNAIPSLIEAVNKNDQEDIIRYHNSINNAIGGLLDVISGKEDENSLTLKIKLISIQGVLLKKDYKTVAILKDKL